MDSITSLASLKYEAAVTTVDLGKRFDKRPKIITSPLFKGGVNPRSQEKGIMPPRRNSLSHIPPTNVVDERVRTGGYDGVVLNEGGGKVGRKHSLTIKPKTDGSEEAVLTAEKTCEDFCEPNDKDMKTMGLSDVRDKGGGKRKGYNSRYGYCDINPITKWR
jgi:hypothetical protein